MNRCFAYSLARRFDFEALKRHFTTTRQTLYRDVVHLHAEGDVFLFSYGVIVTWGLSAEAVDKLIAEIKPFTDEALATPASENYLFAIDPAEGPRMRDDRIVLPGVDDREKLAVSYGIAQSVKLSELEDFAQTAIDETASIPRNIARVGSSGLGRRAIARMRGRLFLAKSEINLRHSLLEAPEFFWDYPAVEHFYDMTARYLDVRPRIEVLNRKLQIIQDMFDMLAGEQQHKHAALLEWIIIWLIAIEIVLFFFT